MDALIEQARDLWEGSIDFQGQRLGDLLATVILSVSGAVAFLLGFASQDIYQTLYVGLGGAALAFLVVVPPWPFFNRKPQTWLPARSGNAALQGVQIEVDGQRVG